MVKMKRKSSYLHKQEEWKQMYDSGMSFTQIGNTEGVHYTTVQTVLKGIVNPRPKQPYAHLSEEWVKLYEEEQWVTTDIANKYNVDVSTVSKYLKKAGVELRRTWSRSSSFEAEIPTWIEMYENGQSLKEIADQYGTYPQTVHTQIKDKIEMREYAETSQIYTFQHPDYLEIIDTPQKAYWLGIWYGTGFVSKAVGGYESTLTLSSKDAETLIRFQKVIGYDRPLENRHVDNMNVTKLRIMNKQFYEHLLQHGLVSDKAEQLAFPVWLSKELQGPFVLGYYEGKGSCSISGGSVKGKVYRSLKLVFIGTPSFLQNLHTIIENHTGIPLNSGTIKHKRKSPVHCLRTGTQAYIHQIANWMYRDVPEFSIQRDIREMFKQV